eukprot:5498699-Alexandrium_andersonii.AAC.1
MVRAQHRGRARARGRSHGQRGSADPCCHLGRMVGVYDGSARPASNPLPDAWAGASWGRNWAGPVHGQGRPR